MRVVDAETYRTSEANRDLWLVFYGADNIGQVRRGIDGKWYPELLPDRARARAVHRVVLAHQALTELNRGIDR
jgi:hypothetical protein